MSRIGFIILGVFFSATALAAPPTSLQDLDKQLVVDRRVVESAEGVELIQGQVEKHAGNPLFQADRPWENSLNNLYPNVVFDADEGLFKLWYKCVLADADAIAKLDPPRTVHDVGWLLLYATSRDGLAWDKPPLGLHSFGGSTANNAVARDTPNVGVFRDTNPDCPADRRFKMVYDTGLGHMKVRFSADGLHWSEPLAAEGLGARVGDTHNNAFWDERLKKYVLISRLVIGERLVARSESDDFIHWQPATLALRSTLEEGRDRQTYCMPSFAYGSGYVGLVMMYNVGTDRTVDCELAWSEDAVTWRRLFPGQPLIPRGAGDAYDSKCIYAGANPPIVRDGKLWLFYGGDDYEHTGWKRHCLPCLAKLRLDGFAGYRATDPQATILTHSLRATLPELTISADAARGSLSVELLDASSGDVLATSEPISANVSDASVRWTGGFSFASLGERSVRLRFKLEGATLYAFRGARPIAERPAHEPPLVRRLPTPTPLPDAKPVVASFDSGADGWMALDELEHIAEGGVNRSGFVRVTREKYQPYLLAEAAASGGAFVGSWPKQFGGDGVRIAFHQRAAAPHVCSSIEIFARDISQWSFDGLPAATSDWTEAATTIRFDWTDAEAEAAGWRPAINAFSWQDTIHNVGRLVIFPRVRDEALTFDVDNVSLMAAASLWTAAAPAQVLDKQRQLDAQTFWDNRDWDWYAEHIPFFECPDADITTTYYYRWELLTKHLTYGSPNSGYSFTEFIDRPFWSGAYGAISCPAGHQLYEARWLRQPRIARDYLKYWFRTPGAQPRNYSTWLADSAWAIHQVHPEDAFAVDLLPDLVKNYGGWEQRHFVPEVGLFWQTGHDDGMEFNINSRQTKDILRGAPSYRPSFNAYMWADAVAIAKLARLAGKTDVAEQYEVKAAKLKERMLALLWDDKRQFFFPVFKNDEERDGHKIRALTKTYEDGQFAGDPHGRELIGYVPWQFPKATASHTSRYDKVEMANDGRTVFTPSPHNRWTAYESKSATDWLEVEFARETEFRRVELAIYDDRGGVQPPASYTIEFWTGSAWQPVAGLTRSPEQPAGSQWNQARFEPVISKKVRIVFTNKGQSRSGVSEVMVWND